MKNTGGILGVNPTVSNTSAVGVWSLVEQASYKRDSTWPTSPLPAGEFTYVGVTSGKASDTGSLATISFPAGTTEGDIAVVRVNIDDTNNTIKASISGWTTVFSNSDQGVFMKALTTSDISSPPSLLSTLDSNAWICYVIRGGYSPTVAVDVTTYGPASYPSSSDLSTTTLGIQTSSDVLVFAGAGGKRDILKPMILTIGGESFDQWTQVNTPGLNGEAVCEFAFKRYTGGTYTNKTIDFQNTNVNNYTEIIFYIRVGA